MQSRITVAGDIGSGKSTLASRIADAVGAEMLSTGGIQRKIATQRGVTVLELNRLADEDPRIDEEIDSYQRNIPAGPAVVESRLAWHFVPDTLKVYLYVSGLEAAKRIVAAQRTDETYSSESDALEKILARRASEIARFKTVYKVDITDLRNYDLVIDTTFANKDAVFDIVTRHAPLDNAPVCWIDYRNIIPTQSIRDLNIESVSELEEKIAAGDQRSLPPIFALYVDHVFYVIDGHARLAAAIRQKTNFVPITIAACNDEPYLQGLTARAYVRDAVQNSRIYDWEDALGFRFPQQIWKDDSIPDVTGNLEHLH